MEPAVKTSEPTDRELLLRHREGDEGALESLVGRWWPMIRRWSVVGSGDPMLADDAAQEALIRVIRFSHRCDAERPFGAWLKTVVFNCCRDLANKERNVLSMGDVEQGVDSNIERRIDLDRGAHRAFVAFLALSCLAWAAGVWSPPLNPPPDLPMTYEPPPPPPVADEGPPAGDEGPPEVETMVRKVEENGPPKQVEEDVVPPPPPTMAETPDSFSSIPIPPPLHPLGVAPATHNLTIWHIEDLSNSYTVQSVEYVLDGEPLTFEDRASSPAKMVKDVVPGRKHTLSVTFKAARKNWSFNVNPSYTFEVKDGEALTLRASATNSAKTPKMVYEEQRSTLSPDGP